MRLELFESTVCIRDIEVRHFAWRVSPFSKGVEAHDKCVHVKCAQVPSSGDAQENVLHPPTHELLHAPGPCLRNPTCTGDETGVKERKVQDDADDACRVHVRGGSLWFVR